jgi:hypothetical protein
LLPSGKITHLYGAILGGREKNYFLIFKIINNNQESTRKFMKCFVTYSSSLSFVVLFLKECSRIAYIIRPIPNEGSIIAGTISSTMRTFSTTFYIFKKVTI